MTTIESHGSAGARSNAQHCGVAIDRTAWGRLRVSGADRVRFLQGLTTVNVEELADGAHAWGAILSPKGRVLSVIDIAHVGDAFVIACEAVLGEPTRAILERYAVMDDVVFEPITGPAHQIWTDVASVWTAPIVEGAAADARPDDDAELEKLRIRAGFLRYGRDVDDDHFPFETPLAALLDYQKGCYVGQEPVFRVHAQGNAARALRGLVVEGTAPLPTGSRVKHPAKDNAGTVTSAIADGDRTLALAYLHRTTWEPGGTVEVAGRSAVVHELPMERA
jgi:tRNA-modifying protein YgfZ